AIRRHGVAWCAIVEVLAVETERELVSYGLADHARAGVEQSLHRCRVPDRWSMRREPVRVTAACHMPSDVEDILGRKGKALQRTIGGARDLEIAMRTESARRKRGGRKRHAGTRC